MPTGRAWRRRSFFPGRTRHAPTRVWWSGSRHASCSACSRRRSFRVQAVETRIERDGLGGRIERHSRCGRRPAVRRHRSQVERRDLSTRAAPRRHRESARDLLLPGGDCRGRDEDSATHRITSAGRVLHPSRSADAHDRSDRSSLMPTRSSASTRARPGTRSSARFALRRAALEIGRLDAPGRGASRRHHEPE